MARTQPLALTCIRRALFLAFLLLTGVVTTNVFHYVQTPTSTARVPVAVFAWGCESISTVLVVWLTTRTAIWRSWFGVLRVVVYITAFTYGGMISSAVQDWWVPSMALFRGIPGTRLDDYAGPSIDLLSLLTDAMLMTPIAIFLGIELSTSADIVRRNNRFTLGGLIVFTTIASIALGWIYFLTSETAPKTAYSGLSQTNAIKDWLRFAPFSIPLLIAASLMMYALTKRCWVATLLFLFAVAVDGVGTRIIAAIVVHLTGWQQGHVLEGTVTDSSLYICGRSLTTASAFFVASLMGVRPSFRIGNKPTNATEQIKD